MIVILGAGYAGAATAWALARRGHGSRVTLIESAPSTGLHASGRNAGLVAPLLDEDPAMAALAVRGASMLAGTPVFSKCGSVRLTADEKTVESVRERARLHGVPLTIERTDGAAASHPLLKGSPTPLAMSFPGDGVVEPRPLLDFYVESARARGVRLLTDVAVTGLSFSCGRLSGVETSQGRIRGEWVVNAAGAWGAEVSARLGDGALEAPWLVPTRRHLFLSSEDARLDPSWPFLWDLTHDVYVRVAGRRLLMCPCDEEPHPAESPEVSPAARALMERRLQAAFPAAARFGIEEGRACLRTFAADRRCVIGPDARLPGFFWVAGLGGIGATAGPAVGDLAADLLLTGGLGGQDWTREGALSFDPARFTPR